MVCSYEGILYIDENKLLPADLKINHGINVIWTKKPDIKEYILYDSIYMQFRTDKTLSCFGLPACEFKLAYKEMITIEVCIWEEMGSG